MLVWYCQLWRTQCPIQDLSLHLRTSSLQWLWQGTCSRIGGCHWAPGVCAVILSTMYGWVGLCEAVPRPLHGAATTCSFPWGETWWVSHRSLLILFLDTNLNVLWWLWLKHYCVVWWMAIPGSHHSWVWPSMHFRLTLSFGHTTLEHCLTCGEQVL